MTTDRVFRCLLDSLEVAQKLILGQSGSVTTVVATVVSRLASPVRRDGAEVAPSAKARLRDGGAAHEKGKYLRWAAVTVNVGDSAAFVYRRVEGTVEELSFASHAGDYRDPQSTPSSLGFANGREPDLDNLSCTLSLLNDGEGFGRAC